MIELTPNKIPLEPIFNNRFTLTLPEFFGLGDFLTISISPIRFNFKTGWDDIIITLHDIIAISATKNISENIVTEQEGTFILNKLDPCGKTIEKITLNCKFIDIDFGGFNYKSDKLNEIKIKVNPISIIVDNG